MAVVTLNTLNKDVVGFDIRSIGGCAIWLDGNDPNANGILPANGANITTWVDKSGLGNNAIAPGTAPTYDLTNKAVNFVRASNQYLSTALSSSVNTETIFMVVSDLGTNQPSGAGGLVPSLIGGNTNAAYRMIQLSSENMVTVRTGTSEFLRTTTGFTQRTLLCSENPGTNVLGSVRHYYNGLNTTGINGTVTAYTTGGTTYIGTQGTAIGAPANSWNGKLYELIVYQSLLTAGQRQSVEWYLARKWGLSASLPVTQAYTKVSPYAAPFTPLSVSGCNLWLDAYDRSTFTLGIGNTLATWTDKSGIGNNVSSIVGTPTYVATGLNNLPSFLLNGSSAIIGPNVNTGTTVSVVVVATMNNAGTNSGGRLLSLGAAGVADTGTVARTGAIVRELSTQALRTIRNGNLSTLALPAYDTPFIATTIFLNGVSNTLTINGVVGTTVNSTGSFGYSLYGIGRDPGTGTAYWNGYVSEVLIYNRTISVAERQQLEGYLANKWGIRSSIVEPFKTILSPNGLLFLPTLLNTTLSVWWDGRDPNNNVASIPLNGAAVTTWTDKTGNTLNATGVNNPTYSATDRAIVFNAASTQYYTTAFTSSATSETICIVAKTATSGADYTLLGSTNTTSRRLRITSTNAPALLTNGGTYTGSSTVTTAVPFLLIVTYTTGTSGVRIRLNGIELIVSPTTAITAPTAAQTTNIGAEAGGASPFDGSIYELFSFSGSALGTTDIQRLEGYLAWKWGLNGNLPITHPYYKIKV